MKRILFLSTFVFLGFRLNSCSDTDLDSPVNETNQPVENNTSDIINNLESSFEVNAARKSKVDDNTARMQSIKQLGV